MVENHKQIKILPTCLDMSPLKKTLICALNDFFRNGKAGLRLVSSGWLLWIQVKQ